jgi:SOS response regulatory protein OraA/RecX
MPNPVNTNQQLADHIKKNLTKGYTMDSLRFSLLQQGYSRTSIEKAIEIANRQLAESAPKMVEKPSIKYEVLNEDELAAKIAAQDNANKGFFGRVFGKIFGKD